jgi:rare lipoprotein A
MAPVLCALVGVAVALSTLPSYSQSNARRNGPRDATPVVETGLASWYEYGERTASGEPFDPEGMTAAHRSLPFGTRLKVERPHSGRSVIVTVNDRGPFVRRRVLDLSRGAAHALGVDGVATVTFQRLPDSAVDVAECGGCFIE